MNRALTFDLSDYLRHRVLGRYRNHHMHMIRPQRPFFNRTLLLLCQAPEHFPQMPPQFLVPRLCTVEPA